MISIMRLRRGPLPPAREVLVLATVLAAFLWAQAPTLGGLARRWRDDPQYTHGYLVPLFALYLAWTRRQHFAAAGRRPSWWGLVLLVPGLALSWAGTCLAFEWLRAAAWL